PLEAHRRRAPADEGTRKGRAPQAGYTEKTPGRGGGAARRPEPEERGEGDRKRARQNVAQAGGADRQERGDAEQVHALGGPALLHHERWTHDRVAALEGALHSGQHEQRRGIVGDDQSSRTEDVSAVGNQKDAGPT